MAHMICVTHKRRSNVINEKIIHSDSSLCDGRFVRVKSRTFDALEVARLAAPVSEIIRTLDSRFAN